MCFHLARGQRWISCSVSEHLKLCHHLCFSIWCDVSVAVAGSQCSCFWFWVKHYKRLLQRPFDSNLKLDGNRLATFLNYVSTCVCCVYLMYFIFIERWTWCFQKIRHWKSRGNFFELRKYVYPVSADWRVLAAELYPPSFLCLSFMGAAISSGSILDLDWLTCIEIYSLAFWGKTPPKNDADRFNCLQTNI